MDEGAVTARSAGPSRIADTLRRVVSIRFRHGRVLPEEQMTGDRTSAKTFRGPVTARDEAVATRDFEELAVAGRQHRAYVQVPDGARAGVVVLHAWWGLND